MIQMLGAVAPLAKILFNTIEKSVPDKDLQEKLKSQLQTQLLQSNTAELQASITITLPGDVWTLLQIGLGGYVVGRSAESVARTMANKPQPKEQENG